MEDKSQSKTANNADLPKKIKIAAIKLHKYKVKQKKKSQRSMVVAMERARLAEYALFCEHPWKLLGINFLIGLARGLGTTIGLAIVLALIAGFTRELISANLPVISKWVADFIEMINDYMMMNL